MRIQWLTSSQVGRTSRQFRFVMEILKPSISTHWFTRRGTRETGESGFSLLEVAIVLVIVGLLSNTFLAPASQYMEGKQRKMTIETLENVRQAVIGFVAAHARLPCPAALNGPPIEVSDCSSAGAWLGAVPAATLGLGGPRSPAGHLIDAWGRPIRYAVSTSDHPEYGTPGTADFLVTGEMNKVGMRNLHGNLEICSEVSSGDCRLAALRANQVPALIFSLGRDVSDSGPGSENLDGDRVFLRQEYSGSKENGFDDLLVWISENILFYRLLQAGVLP